LTGPEPDAAPDIAPHYLSTEEDRHVAARSIRLARQIAAAGALARFRPVELLPGASVGDDDEALARAAGDVGTTIFHPVGTAKMGLSSDPLAVVDERLRVFGVEGLRVADAADHHLRQHKLPNHHDRRKGRRDDPGRLVALTTFGRLHHCVLEHDRSTDLVETKLKPSHALFHGP